MKLVIVESPTKARKLSGFLGPDYQVESSVGHVADLPKSQLGVDIDNNFAPIYEISADKEKVANRLQQLARQSDTVYLASDPDREGEAIAWHVKNIIEDGLSASKSSKSEKGSKSDSKSPKKSQKSASKSVPVSKSTLKSPKFLRATFHEITKSAVQNAIDNPTDINLDLVDAQQARRVLDRLVGYKVSPVLWRKVRRGLSAGRVQSVALRLIAEREREIEAFKPEEYWELNVILSDQSAPKLVGESIVQNLTTPAPNSPEAVSTPKKTQSKKNSEIDLPYFSAQLIKVDQKKFQPHSATDTQSALADLPTAAYQVSALTRKQTQKQSQPPFITSTLQQSAATVLGFTSKQTMSLAQNLYEEGLITYHRTDSFNLSTEAVEKARDYIGTEFGSDYLPATPRAFSKKSKNAQEAHEAIRVTNISLRQVDPAKFAKFTTSHARLYDLIWRRFIASQMAAAVYNQTTALILATPINSSTQYELKANGSVLKFDGWVRLFPHKEDKLLPEFVEKQPLDFHRLIADQKFTQPPARYNDASIIKELESRGIGRPSTYASIISTIIARGYVERQQKKFFATPVGLTVTDFLLENLEEFIQYDFTAEMEDNLDDIAQGKKQWQKVIGDFYHPFEKKLEAVGETAARVAIPVEPTGEACPLCGDTDQGEVVIRSGRYGKFRSCSRYPECKFTENITTAVPDVKCPVCRDGDILAKRGRFGLFYACSRYPDCDWRGYRPPKPGEVLTAEEWEEQKAARAERAAKRKATMEANKKADSKSTTKKSTKAVTKKKKPASKKSTTVKKTATKKPASTKKSAPPKKPASSSKKKTTK